jgi:archaemetzincin
MGAMLIGNRSKAVFVGIVIAIFCLINFADIVRATDHSSPPRTIYIQVYDKDLYPIVKQMLPEISKQYFGLPVKLMSMVGHQRPGWIEKNRKQARAETVIADVRKNMPRDGMRIVGLVNVDLYTGRTPWIFGVGDPKTGAAIVSTFRLRTSEKSRFRERLLTGIVHELGHTFGLIHCNYPRNCVMGFTSSLADYDYKPAQFCNTCREKLRRAIESALPDEPGVKRVH